MNYKLRKAISMMVIFVVFVVGFASFIEKASFNVSAAETGFPTGYRSYVVQSGDSLWSIAKENLPEDEEDIGAFVKEIKNINKLQSDFIYDGQLLAVPCYGYTTVVCSDKL